MSTIPKLENVLVQQQAGLVIITLNRPNRFNAFSRQSYEDLITALAWADKNESCVCVLLTGAGSFFSSGNDLSNFSDALTTGISPEKMSADSAVLLFRFVNAFIYFSKPLLAAVNGPAIGIATTLLGLCDIVYASETATFNTPFSSLGQSPEGCSSYVFPRIMGISAANEVLLGGKKLNAHEAVQHRLVAQVLPGKTADEFRKNAIQIAASMAALPAASLKLSKSLVRSENDRKILEQVNKKECDILQERWISEDCMNAIMKFMAAQQSKTKKPKAKL